MWTRLKDLVGLNMSNDREHYSPTYDNEYVSPPLEQKVSIRLRLARDGQTNGVTWVPEAYYTRDVETQRINVLHSVQSKMTHVDKDRMILLTIAPTWAINEVTDAVLGGLCIAIEQLFSGVTMTSGDVNAMTSSKEQEVGSPHPDDTNTFSFFVHAGQRGPFEDVNQHAYISRASHAHVAQFAGREDVFLEPASKPTLRDMLNIAPPPDNNNDNNVIRPPPPADFEILSIKHPLMAFINASSTLLKEKQLLYASNVKPVVPKSQERDVRNRLHQLPERYRVDRQALDRVRQWLREERYSKIRYTRLTRTGLRVIMQPEQSAALFERYKDVLCNAPEQAPCLTLVLHVEYMIVQHFDIPHAKDVHERATLWWCGVYLRVRKP